MTVLAPSCHPSPGTSPVPCALSMPVAARPSRIPRWRLAKRSLVAAADRAGAGGGASAVAVAVPGMRFAWGTRRGRPATVVPPEAGATATSAARQPSSPGEAQLVLTGCSGWAAEPAGHSTEGRPRRNQSDSTASKIGSLFSSPSDAGGGTITPPAAVPNRESWVRNVPLSGKDLATGAPKTG
jgi:hypothetical protein